MQSKRNSIIYVIAILSTIIAYWINVKSLTNISVIIVVSGVIISIFDIKRGCQFFFLAALVFSDYTFESVVGSPDIGQSVSLGGIYMANMGGATLMVYWALLNVILMFIKRGGWAINKIRTSAIMKILVIIFLFSIIGFAINLVIGGLDVLRTAISDVRMYVNIILGFLTVLLIVTDRNDIKKYFNVFALVLLTELVITIASSYFTSQNRIIHTFFSGTETYYNGVLFLFLLLLLKERKKVAEIHISPIFIISALLIVLLFLFVVPSRGRMIALGFPVLVYLICAKRWKLLISIPVFLFLAIYLVQLINPRFYDYFLWKFSTFDPNAAGADSSAVRKVEMINIFGELFTNPYYLFLGKGLGGFFQTGFMNFTGVSLGTSSYPAEWIAEGKFYKPHGTLLYLLLKNGVVMTCLFYYYIIRLFTKGIKVFKNKVHSYNKIIALSFLISLPAVSVIIFSSKLQIMFGMMIGFISLALQFMHYEETRLNESLLKKEKAFA